VKTFKQTPGMKTNKFWLFAILAVLFIATACEKDSSEPEPEPTKELAPVLTRKINTFIKDVMNDVYLWYKEIPKIDQNYESDSKAYFKKLVYKEDKWSYVTDNVKKLEDSFQGIEKSFGYSLAFEHFTGTDTYFAIIEYVYPNTPASSAGFTRGDLITKISGSDITADNYRELLNGSSITVTKGVYTSGGIAPGASVSMTAEVLSLNPVLMYKTINHAGKKIGYLLYTQYIHRFNNKIDEALQYFKNENITDLVLDLRYNPGGYTSAAQHLCSSLAPLNVVNTTQPLITYQWNDKYQSHWTSTNNQSQLRVPFVSSVPVKMGLNRLHILTGAGTASASEFTIIGLEPYMEIITVGDTTYGKYTASITLKPEDFLKDSRGVGWYNSASDYKEFENWGVQPIVLRYANSQGITNFKDGFAPKFLVRDQLLPALPLGDLTEPLLRKAVENITGTPVLAAKSAATTQTYEIFDRGFSRFDVNKRNMPVNDLLKVDFMKNID